VDSVPSFHGTHLPKWVLRVPDLYSSCTHWRNILSTGFSRVAGWYIFKPKIQIWVKFGGPWNGKGLYILWPVGIFYGHLAKKWQFCYILARVGISVARWFVFKPKIPILVKLGGS
jgi:hypothetical protein